MQIILDKDGTTVGKISYDFVNAVEDFVRLIKGYTALDIEPTWFLSGDMLNHSALTGVSIDLIGEDIEYRPEFLADELARAEEYIHNDDVRSLLEAFKNSTPYDEHYVSIEILE